MKKLIFTLLLLSSLFADYRITQYIGVSPLGEYYTEEYVAKNITNVNGGISFWDKNGYITLYGNIKISQEK